MPDRVTVSSRRRRAPSPVRSMAIPRAAPQDAAPVSEVGVLSSLADVTAAFTNARMLSDQRRLADSVEGQSHDISMKVTAAPERTFGIGVDDAYRGGNTVISEVLGVGEVEIRLRSDADSGSFRSGSEHSLNASIAGWNGIHKRLILYAQ